MARSIGDWYADHADGSDGNADDEVVEGQPIWDVLGPARSPSQLAGRSKKQQPPRAAAPRAKVSREQLIREMRRAHPRISYDELVHLLRSKKGVRVTRAEVSAALKGYRTAPSRTQQQPRRAVPVVPMTSTAARIPARPRTPPAPASLSLDEPTHRRKKKKKGWHRVSIKPASASARRAEKIPPCNACGVIPSQFGVCRCT